MCMCECSVFRGQKRALYPSRTGVTGTCGWHIDYRKLTGRQEQYMLLTLEPSLQPRWVCLMPWNWSCRQYEPSVRSRNAIGVLCKNSKRS